MLKDLIGLISLLSVGGSDIFIYIKHDEVKVNNAIVVLGNVECGNDVIHVIDSVTFP